MGQINNNIENIVDLPGPIDSGQQPTTDYRYSAGPVLPHFDTAVDLDYSSSWLNAVLLNRSLSASELPARQEGSNQLELALENWTQETNWDNDYDFFLGPESPCDCFSSLQPSHSTVAPDLPVLNLLSPRNLPEHTPADVNPISSQQSQLELAIDRPEKAPKILQVANTES